MRDFIDIVGFALAIAVIYVLFGGEVKININGEKYSFSIGEAATGKGE